MKDDKRDKAVEANFKIAAYVLKKDQTLWYGIPVCEIENIKNELSPGDMIIYPEKVVVATGKIVLKESDES